jgi:twinkle protein
MGKIVENDQPCLDQVGCCSSDGVQVYEDGAGFCFSCKKRWGDYVLKANGVELPRKTNKSTFRESSQRVTDTLAEVLEYPIRPLKDRNIPREICDFFGVRVSFNEEQKLTHHYYPYEGDANFKIRRITDKKFFWAVPGKVSKDLFGRDKFNSGGKRVIVVEGEIDVLSVAVALKERYGKIYPVVGLSSGVMTDSLLLHRDWLRSFDEVVLFMDQDKVGEEALSKALKIVGTDKARIVKTSQYKDANEVLSDATAGGSKILMQLIFDAAPYVPSGIIAKDEIRKRMIDRQNRVAIPYPPCVRGLNVKLGGMRGGEITLFISGTGSGKTTLMKEDVLWLLDFQPKLELLIAERNLQLEEGQEPLKPFNIKVGAVMLEEPPEETAEKLVTMHLRRNPEEEFVSQKLILDTFDEIFDDEKIMLLDHQGSMGDGSIIEKLEYMILSGCTHLFVDHITILVSEGAEGLTGNEAIDKVMNDLLRLVTRYPHVWIGLVSHLRKAASGKPFEAGHMPTIDDIKGSGSIKQISFDIVAFCRDMTAATEDEQNHIMMSVLKCRRTGRTGETPGARYHRPTGRLQYVSDESFSTEATETIVDITPRSDDIVIQAVDVSIPKQLKNAVVAPDFKAPSVPPAASTLRVPLKVPPAPPPSVKGF